MKIKDFEYTDVNKDGTLKNEGGAITTEKVVRTGFDNKVGHYLLVGRGRTRLGKVSFTRVEFSEVEWEKFLSGAEIQGNK